VSEQLKVERDGGVLVLSLNRPEKKNAITDAMYAVLAEALEAANADREVRAILIRAEGETFSAGNDIGDFAAVAMGARSPETLAVMRVIRALAALEKPLVAAVKGLAVGIGTTLLLHCDLVYVAEDARLTTPFADLALTPEAASSLLLPLRIGHARAFAMFALGEALDGRTAAATGLANAALPAAEVDGYARAAARALAARPLGALMATKRLMRDAEAIWAVMQTEGRIFVERLTTPEAREAFTAFAERRAPDFSRIDFTRVD
jgi:enoyl-CoA hydratase/carnithine racemase